MFGVDESKQKKTSMYQALGEMFLTLSRLFDYFCFEFFNLKETMLFPVGCLMCKLFLLQSLFCVKQAKRFQSGFCMVIQ